MSMTVLGKIKGSYPQLKVLVDPDNGPLKTYYLDLVSANYRSEDWGVAVNLILMIGRLGLTSDHPIPLTPNTEEFLDGWVRWTVINRDFMVSDEL